jgi:predicted RNA-binding Zn-ribbon protein involved in translation (DUF1610 family)
MVTVCPYCNEEIEWAAIHREWAKNNVMWANMQREWAGSSVMCFDFECPECGKMMEIDVERDPVFLAHKKSGDLAHKIGI